MSAHDAWQLVCRWFGSGAPVLQATLSPRERALLPLLGKAIRATVVDQSWVLCPHCLLHRAQVWGDGLGGRLCRCPECGPVAVEVYDVAALALNEDWLHRNLRRALEIESRDGIDDLGGAVWRLGDSRRSPVLLARDIVRLWREPAVLDRVRVAGGDIRVITPKPRETRGSPFGAGVEWLALEDRFSFYGGGISFVGDVPGKPASGEDADTTAPVNGPFSADFMWVTLPGEEGSPIRCTKAQAAVFRALWDFKGEPRNAEQVMGRAKLNSQKPVDVFKDKRYAEQLRAFHTLVVTQQRAGLYSMPCAARARV